MHPHFTEVEAETGSGKAAQLVGVKTGASGAQSHQGHLNAPPLGSEGLRDSCLLPSCGGNIDALWGQLSTNLLGPGQAVCLSEPQFLICKCVQYRNALAGMWCGLDELMEVLYAPGKWWVLTEHEL